MIVRVASRRVNTVVVRPILLNNPMAAQTMQAMKM
jgi:hypothetical protein